MQPGELEFLVVTAAKASVYLEVDLRQRCITGLLFLSCLFKFMFLVGPRQLENYV